MLALAQHSSPPAGPWVGSASAVGVDDNHVLVDALAKQDSIQHGTALHGFGHSPRIGISSKRSAPRLAEDAKKGGQA
jgi:hypothetical protein